MAKPYLQKHLIALSGEFFVAAMLCLKGYVASLTLKNYPNVDIFALNPKTDNQVAVQVKTIRGGNAYYVPKNVDKLANPFVFVYIRDNVPEFYIVPSKDVAQISKTELSAYLRKHPHIKAEQPPMISLRALTPFRDKWDNLGLELG